MVASPQGTITPSIADLRVEDLEIKVLGPCRIPSPLAQVLGSDALQAVGEAERIVVDNRVSALARYEGNFGAVPSFELAGPRDRIYFDPSKTRAGIVTCGGICPGLNNVIRGLVSELHQGYGVRRVYGFRYGYQGVHPEVSSRGGRPHPRGRQGHPSGRRHHLGVGPRPRGRG